MNALMETRNKYKDEFFEKHGVKLGFMRCIYTHTHYRYACTVIVLCLYMHINTS